jgi:hypothetical protein
MPNSRALHHNVVPITITSGVKEILLPNSMELIQICIITNISSGMEEIIPKFQETELWCHAWKHFI